MREFNGNREVRVDSWVHSMEAHSRGCVISKGGCFAPDASQAEMRFEAALGCCVAL